jgi:hypothetical protein
MVKEGVDSMRWKTVVGFAALAGLTGGIAAAQSIVSARAGAVHHIEGTVLLDGKEVVREESKFPQMAEGSVLETELGRAEILLTPGVVLRLAERSAIKLVSSKLTDTRVDFMRGAALVEAMEILEDNTVTLFAGESTIQLQKEGLYRLDGDPLQLRVYDGKAQVARDGQQLEVKKGRIVELGAFLAATKFDPKQDDALYRWSSRRSGYMAMANLSAARSMDRWGVPWSMSGWRWNPYFGLFTFVPAYGFLSSPFGYDFYSPGVVYMVYAPPRRVDSGGGWGGGGGYSPHYGYVVTGSRGASTGSVGGGAAVSGGAAASAGSVGRGGGDTVGRGGAAGGGRGR